MARIAQAARTASLVVAFALTAVNASPGQESAAAGTTNCVYCSYCFLGGPGHLTHDGGSYGAPHSVCVNYVGCGHPPCGAATSTSQEAVLYANRIDLAERAAGGSVAAALELANESRVAWYNSSRQALQVTSSCGEPGVILAHIPLNEEQVASIESDGRKARTLASR